ncbi:MAG: glycosyltransferase [Candidatus Levyibacteriota bacterium]
MKVALVYDRVNKWGGAERVLLALKELFPDATLFTSVFNSETAGWANVFTIQTSFLQHVPFAKSHHEAFASLMPIAFETFSFDEYDVVISLTSEAAKGVITKPATVHICLCLTPTRYLWSGHDEYFENPFLKFVAMPVLWYLRQWDIIAANRPDKFLAISKEVQTRIKKYYKKEADVLYPPLLLHDANTPSIGSGYFLVVSRLIPIKKIDIAIKACNTLQVPLKIIGTGSQETYLKSIAGPTISFLGSLTDSQVVGYYKGCTALLFPGIEDFGLTILEANAFGKPVIAFQGGGALETVVSGKTGEFFPKQTESSLTEVMQDLLERKKITLLQTEQTQYKNACIQNAKKFTMKKFEQSLHKSIASVKKYL